MSQGSELWECTFIAEPRDENYRALVDALLPHCSTVLLVVREQLDLSEGAREVLQDLLPFRIRSVRTNEWPGTKLLGHRAEVSYYALSPHVAEIVKKAVCGLFEWKQPERPEDLCLLANGAEVLTTIAHEADGWLALPEPALDRIHRAVGSRLLTTPRRRPTTG